MQTVSASLETELLAHETGDSNFDLLELIEVYSSSYQPHITNGYEPGSAEKRWCGVLGFTFLTLAYEREYIDRGDVQRYFDKRENNVTLNFSNISRQLAQWVQATEIEGKQLVIRVVSRGSSTVLADSLVIFTGRLDKPGDFGDEAGSLTAAQRFGQINQTFPPRTFGPNDPQGRAPNDPKFEGFRFSAQSATVLWTTRERRTGPGAFLGLTKKVQHSFQASSKTDLSSELVVPDAFGRVQLFATYLATLDIGGAINFAAAVSEGVIAEYIQIKQINPKFSQISANPAKFYGYLGNEGPVGREQKPIRILNPSVPNHPGDGYYSRTAWFAGFVSGSSVDIDEAEAPDWIVLIKGKIIKTPDGSGVFNVEEWSDNPSYIARYILSNERYFNEGESAIDDATCWSTGLECDEFVLDSTKGEWTFIPQADADKFGAEFSTYRSTGLVDSRYVRMKELLTLAGDPPQIIADIEPFDPTDPPEPFDPPTNPNLRATVLRKRHTCNVTITEKISGLDFLYNVLAPTGRLFFRRNGKGKIQILREKPADNTRLRAALSPGATSVFVTDVDPWKSGALLLTQKLLIGNTLTTSEVRVVTGATYTADGNSITLASSGSGGITAIASGANLTGGSTTVPASGTVTLSGSAAGTITATINGLVCTYTLDSFDSLASAAILLARYINATPKLNQFVKASASGSVVTITAKWGVLTVAALANSHTAEVGSPTSAPGLTAASGGVLPAGTWYVGYARRTAIGATALSPIASVVLTANQKINVTDLTPLPAGVSSLDWYASKYADSTELVFWANNNGTAFSIGTSAVPTASNDLPPDMNESGEELLRVAKSFASNDQGAAVLAQAGLTKGNIHKGTFKWPLPSKQSSTNMVHGTFFDSTEDYAPTPLEVHDYAHQSQIRKVNKKEVDLSGFDNHNQSSRQLNFILSKHREGDWFDSFSTDPSAMLLEEGDVICASSDNGGLVNVVTRVEELSIGPAPTFTTKIVGRKYSTRMFSDNVRQHSIRLPTTLRAITPIPSAIKFIDNYPIRDSDGLEPGFKVAVSFDKNAQGSWKGWQLWADYGDGYVQVAAGDVAAIMGTATSTLGSVTDVSDWDRTNSVTFSATYGLNALDPAPFGSVTETDIEANPRRNLFLVGNEYIQAGTITDNGNHSYTLSTLLRGRFDTDQEQLTHGPSEDVIFLNGAEALVPTDLTKLNVPIPYKVVTVNENVANVASVLFTWTGNILKPRKVQNVQISVDASNDWLIQFRPNALTRDDSNEFAVEIWASSSRTNPSLNRIRVLPVTVGTAHAALLLASNVAYQYEVPQEGGPPTLVANSTHAQKNNFAVSALGGDAITIEAIAQPFSRFDFSFRNLDEDGGLEVGISDSPLIVAGLQPGAFAGTGNFLGTGFPANCPLSVEWELPSTYDNPSSVAKEIWRSFGTAIALREDVDAGFGGGDIPGFTGSLGLRGGPRYTFLVSGTEIRGYVNYTPAAGDKPITIINVATLNNILDESGAAILDESGNAISGEVTSLPFPFHLAMQIVETVQASSLGVTQVMLGGNLFPTTIYSQAQQIADFGSPRSQLFLRLYQISSIPRIGAGVPLDIVIPITVESILDEIGSAIQDEAGDNILAES